MRTMDEPRVEALWLPSADAERLVGLSRTSLWRLSRAGRVKTARVGRAVRYERESLLSLMAENATPRDID